MNRFPFAAALAASLLLAACQTSQSSADGAPAAPAPVPKSTPAAPPAPPAPVAQEAMLDRIETTGARRRLEATRMAQAPAPTAYAVMPPQRPPAPPANREEYADLDDNPVRRASEHPVSTFSVDVDTGSYSNVRRMLRAGVRPPPDAVRAEEFINYFDHGHPAPRTREVPFAVTTEIAPAPWDPARHLLMVGIRGYDVPKAQLPPANLVFLVDTSGSMHSPDKLPLLRQAFGALVDQLRAQDRVSIVAYAGSAGLVLPPTAGDRKGEILAALGRLQAGGSTNGGAGIELAYAMARQGFVEGGANRVILATDGDFNVGTVDRDALEAMVADQRGSGIALTTLGFGTGNYNDAMAERLADAGDGNHAYVDTLLEARKVLVEEMASTLLTIARDVKVQVEFNPAVVAEYRLVGYSNRMLREEDFANDRVDAGDIGAGHEVTALYEIALAGSGGERLPALRYAAPAQTTAATGELAHLRLRYKLPGNDRSRLIEVPLRRDAIRAQPGESLRFAATVAAFADALRGGHHLGGWNWDAIAASAAANRGDDRWGLRAEFATLVEAGRLATRADAHAGGD
ncbi:VWA domain-containing protein [Luteimonas sp. MC1895]|uniref:vWA domain-containing protein n=1 Tax=Luteimonas sp. MC1895 TaxID=2819513 RepID=UPI0018F07967|nr:VWA domain-containing protein [Luteimonas sp. MC1895]MBJ6979544.1 VWA domain-containing protein [Luteimonas sp. MC1895]